MVTQKKSKKLLGKKKPSLSNKPTHSTNKGRKGRTTYVHDHYTAQAQREGYAARSVFKLKEIDEQFQLINGNSRVLELGAAPGSWSRYVLKQFTERGATTGRKESSTQDVNTSARLIAVDLLPLESDLLENKQLRFFKGDFNDAQFEEILVEELKIGGAFNLILSDMAPRTTGNRTVDSGRSEALVRDLMEKLHLWLKPNGNLLFKLFQGGEEKILQDQLRLQFTKSLRIVPKAVRSRSFEVYFLCLGYKGQS